VIEEEEEKLKVGILKEEFVFNKRMTRTGGDVNGDELDNPLSTVSQSSRDESSARDISTEDSPSKKDKKKKKGLRTPSFLKKKSKEKKKSAADA